MKKLLYSAAAIAVSFGVFAFTPMEKNNNMDNAIVDFVSDKEGCSEFYKTYKGASECWSTSTPTEPTNNELVAAQRTVLNSY